MDSIGCSCVFPYVSLGNPIKYTEKLPVQYTSITHIDSAAEADRVFSMLMGDDVPPRRSFIEANAKYANIDA